MFHFKTASHVWAELKSLHRQVMDLNSLVTDLSSLKKQGEGDLVRSYDFITGKELLLFPLTFGDNMVKLKPVKHLPTGFPCLYWRMIRLSILFYWMIKNPAKPSKRIK